MGNILLKQRLLELLPVRFRQPRAQRMPRLAAIHRQKLLNRVAAHLFLDYHEMPLCEGRGKAFQVTTTHSCLSRRQDSLVLSGEGCEIRVLLFVSFLVFDSLWRGRLLVQSARLHLRWHGEGKTRQHKALKLK